MATNYTQLQPGTDRSGTITAGTTAQTLAAAYNSRVSLRIQNIDAAEDLWVREGGTAAIGAAGSYQIKAGLTYEVQTNLAVSVNATTTGHKFTAYEI